MRAIVSLPLVLVLAAGLAACDDFGSGPDKGPKSLEEAKAEAQQMERPEPGQYTQTTRFTKFEVPGAPKEMAARMKGMMEGKGETASYCLTKEDSEKGFEEMFRKVGEGECKYERFDASANAIDAILVCDTGQGGSARLTMNGTVSKTGSTVKVDVEQKNAKKPMGNATIAMEVSSKRTGECVADKS